jgi:hypothetical protein
MKSIVIATTLVTAFAGPAFAQGGNIHGTESRGAPVNSSYRASAVNPETGVTPGSRASQARAYVKKKKRAHIIREPAR